MTLGRLTVDLLLRAGAFQSDLQRSSRATKKHMKEIEQSVNAAGKVIGVALVAGVGAFTYAVKEAIDNADLMSKAAQKIGLATESLSRLAYAADLSDVSLDQLQGGLAKLTKLQASAAQGNKEASRVFSAFGIAVRDAGGNLRGTEAVLQDFAQVFANLADGPEKTALALQVFGKSGAELIPLLNEGAAGLRKMAQEADRFGLTVDSVAGKQAEEFNDDLTRMQAQVKGLANSIARPLLPELGKLAESLSNLNAVESANFGDAIAAGIARLSKAIRSSTVEIEFWKKAWNEQGLFGEGIISVTQRAHAEFERREALSEGLAIHRGPLGRGTARKGALEGQADLAAKRVQDQARSLFTPDLTSGKAARAARDTSDALADLHEQIAKVAAAGLDFNTQLEDMQAELGGPLDKALLEHNRKLAELDDLAKRGEISTEKLAKAKAAETALYERDVRAIEERLDVGGRLLADLEFERSLIEATNAERQTAIQLRGLDAESVAKYGEAILAANKDLEAVREQYDRQVAAMDEFRGSFADTVTDVLTGTKSIADAFRSLADQIVAQIARMIANNLTASLFGQPGSAGGGSAGGWLSSIFSIFAGGSSGSSSSFGIPLPGTGLIPGFASGTDYAPGGLAWVGESGKELVELPRGSKVYPHGKGPGGRSIVINQSFAPGTDRKTINQSAQETAQAIRVAARDS